MHKYLIILFLVVLGCTGRVEAWTLFGNLRGNCYDHRYYNVNGYDPWFVGYQDMYSYPSTYKLPWNRCFNYCTKYPRPCFCCPRNSNRRPNQRG